jgi:dCMP deaminase
MRKNSRKKTYNVEKRPTWDEYFIKLAWLIAERSTCMRHHVGAVIVKDKRILTTGYNGAVSGSHDCIQRSECVRNTLNIPSGQKQEICSAVHAEQNAIIQCSYSGIMIKNATLYCTHSPCILCAKMIINAAIKNVIVSVEYSDNSFKKLFLESNINFSILNINNFLIKCLL